MKYCRRPSRRSTRSRYSWSSAQPPFSRLLLPAYPTAQHTRAHIAVVLQFLLAHGRAPPLFRIVRVYFRGSMVVERASTVPPSRPRPHAAMTGDRALCTTLVKRLQLPHLGLAPTATPLAMPHSLQVHGLKLGRHLGRLGPLDGLLVAPLRLAGHGGRDVGGAHAGAAQRQRDGQGACAEGARGRGS